MLICGKRVDFLIWWWERGSGRIKNILHESDERKNALLGCYKERNNTDENMTK